MKTTEPELGAYGKRHSVMRQARQPGFALIGNLTLMILLTVIAVGLLSLIAISLRSSGQSSALQHARANARLAMMLAIPEYISEKDLAHLKPGDLKAPINQTFWSQVPDRELALPERIRSLKCSPQAPPHS